VSSPRWASPSLPRPCGRSSRQRASIQHRSTTTWAEFLRSQADAILACDFIETVTLTGQRQYILTIIEHATRRVRILGATAHPTAGWTIQAARNLAMDLDDAGARARYLIRDRDAKYPALFDTVLHDAGIQVVLSGIRVPRMNSIMERWVLTCRRELLDRTLIWNQRHLLHALREFETQQDGLRGEVPGSRFVNPGLFPRSLPPNPAGTF
jgi:putative transposase